MKYKSNKGLKSRNKKSREIKDFQTIFFLWTIRIFKIKFINFRRNINLMPQNKASANKRTDKSWSWSTIRFSWSLSRGSFTSWKERINSNKTGFMKIIRIIDHSLTKILNIKGKNIILLFNTLFVHSISYLYELFSSILNLLRIYIHPIV